MKAILIFIILWFIFFLLNYNIYYSNISFNQANKSYINKQFIEALNKYSKSYEYNKNNTDITYNISNTLYKLAENIEDNDTKVQYYEKSLKWYESKLFIDNKRWLIEDIDTRFNYELLKKKLEEEKKKQEEKKQEKKQNNKKEEKQQDKDKNNKKNEKQKKNRTYKDKSMQLNKKDLWEIKRYIEKLKQEQKYNRKFYWKQKQDIDPFFNNIFNNNKKDW
jgi:Ca-activated chloride channel family protein